MRVIGLALLGAILTLGPARPSWSQTGAGTTDVSIDAVGGLPRLLGDDVRLKWIVPGDPEASRALSELRYDAVDEDTGAGIRRTLTSRELVDGRRLTHRYDKSREGAAQAETLRIDLDLPRGAAIEMTVETGFVPEPLPGFGAIYSKVRAIVVDADGQQELESPAGTFAEQSVEAGDWFGIRSRFRAGLLRSGDATLDIRFDTAQESQPRVAVMPSEDDARLAFELYAGPIESERLAAADPQLKGMLYAALWDWLRLLCFGMAWLLGRVHAVVGSVGLSVIFLSVCVKLLMSPLTLIADRWQESVNKTQALLEPQILAIKQEYKGEDAHNRILAAYREHGVHPLYTLKSLAGFLILIPVFIAAFDTLGESTLLDETPFLWIDDLAKPDRAALLPFELPFFGAHLNLLPFLMTGITLFTSWFQTDPSLTPALLRKQRVRLYLMAVLFFVLFYTFPAGMVLYWTTNNVLHLVRIQVSRLW